MDVDITLDKNGKLTYRLENGELIEMSKSSGSTSQYLKSIPANVNPTMLNLWGLKASSFQSRSYPSSREDNHSTRTKTSFALKSPKSAGQNVNQKGKSKQPVLKKSQDTSTQCDETNGSKLEYNGSKVKTSTDKSQNTEIPKNQEVDNCHDPKQENAVSSPKTLTSFASSGRLSRESTPSSTKSQTIMQSWASKRVNSPVTYKNPAENDWVVRTSVISNGRNVHRVTTDHSPVVMRRENLSDKTLEMCRSDPYLASLLFSKEQRIEKSVNNNQNVKAGDGKPKNFTSNASLSVEACAALSSATKNQNDRNWEIDKMSNQTKMNGYVEETSANSQQAPVLTKSDKTMRCDQLSATESLPNILDPFPNEYSSEDFVVNEKDHFLISGTSKGLVEPTESGFGDRQSIKSDVQKDEISDLEARASPLTFRPIGQQILSPIYNSCDENENADEVVTQMQTFRGTEGITSSRNTTVLSEVTDNEKSQSLPQTSAIRSRITPRRAGKTPRTPSTSRRVTFRDEKSSSESNLSDSCYGIPKPTPKYLRKNSNIKVKVRIGNESEPKQSARKLRNVNGELSNRSNSGSNRKKTNKGESSDDEFERFWKVSMEEWKSLSPYQKYLKYKTMTQTKPVEASDRSKRSKILDSDSDTFLEKENLSQLKKKTENKPSGINKTENDDKTKCKAKDICDSETDFKFGNSGKMKYYAELNDLAEDFLFSKPETPARSKATENAMQSTETANTTAGVNSTSVSWDFKSFRGEESFRTERESELKNAKEHCPNDRKQALVSSKTDGIMHESLLLETYRSKETERNQSSKDVLCFNEEINDDAASIVSVSTFMPETLRSISEAFSRMDGGASKLSIDDTNDDIADFLFTSRKEPPKIENDNEDVQGNEKNVNENLELESGSADSLIDKLYEEPDRKISAVRPIGQKNQFITKSSVDDFLTFKDFVNPYNEDNETDTGELKTKADQTAIGFEELDQLVADKFGGQTVRDMCKNGQETFPGMVLESINAEETFLNDSVQLAASIPVNFAKIKPYKHLRADLKKEAEKRNGTASTSNGLKLGQNQHLQTTQQGENKRRPNSRGSRPGSKSPIGHNSSVSPRSRQSHRRSRSPNQKASRPNVSAGQVANSSTVDPQKSPWLQPSGVRHEPGSDLQPLESGTQQTSAAAQLPGNSDGYKAPSNQGTSNYKYQGTSQGQYMNPNPQNRIPAQSAFGAVTAPRLVNVKEAQQKGYYGPLKASQKGTSQAREHKHVIENPNLLQSQNMNLAGVAIKSRSNSPHLVRPSSGNRVGSAHVQRRNQSPASAARARNSQHSPLNLASPRQGSAQRQSRSPSPNNMNTSPRHRNPKEERFSKYLTELHASLIQRSVLSTPSLSDAGVRQKCGSLLASPMNRNNAEPNMWLAIPPEIWLYICSLLDPADRCTLGLVCRSLNSLSCDFTLWGTIIVKGKTLTPDHLKSIQIREPKSLSLLQCDFKDVNDEHLRMFFREISDSLQELNIAGCTSKDCNANTILVHAGTRCSSLVGLDTSWSNLGPHTLVAFSEHVSQLESLSLNGCASITDDCVTQVLEKHGQTMKKLTVFGCFKLDRSLLKLSSLAPNMQVLHLGNIPYVTDDTLRQIAMALKDLREIDIRSSRNITDEAIYSLSFYCRRLTSLNMSNCTQLSDYAMANLGGYCMNLANLEVDGCSRISDEGVQKLVVESRVIMRKLGLSATNVTSESCNAIRDHCPVLEELKLSSCQAKISIESLKALIAKVKSLRSLDLYGFDKTRVSKNLVGVNKNLQIHV